MANRQWSTRFFTDETIPVTKTSAVWKGTWPGKAGVIWASGASPNGLNPKLNPGVLSQPEIVSPRFLAQDNAVSWTLFVPSAIVTKDAASSAATPPSPPPLIPTTLLLGRGDEEVGYGLRFFFERAGTGALLCLSGREGADPGGRWNVGITQATVESIFRTAGLAGKPQIQVLAGYSTGYGVVQTINNDLVPLSPVKRLVLFDCIYRCDSPALPSGQSPPALLPRDRPEFTGQAPPQIVLDEGKQAFRPNPFNTRRAVTKLTAAAPSATFAAYSTTSGGSPRYAIWRKSSTPQGVTNLTLLRLGTRPVVDVPALAELRDQHPANNGWSPSLAYDVLALARYLQLGKAAGLVSDAELRQVPFMQAAIARGLPVRGTVFASANTRAAAVVPTGSSTIDLLTWVATLTGVVRQAERNLASRIVRDHQLVLPGWLYDAATDLDEFRHAASLSEFGWELLPP